MIQHSWQTAATEYGKVTAMNGLRSATTLVVEDHPALRLALYTWLKTLFPAMTVVEAGSGEDAVALAVSVGPAIVLMDIGLPGIDGIEATQRIKQVRPQTQVVVVSINEGNEYRVAAQNAGASGFVAKRSVYSELVPLLESLFDV